jgi:hypothetical protein
VPTVSAQALVEPRNHAPELPDGLSAVAFGVLPK